MRVRTVVCLAAMVAAGVVGAAFAAGRLRERMLLPAVGRPLDSYRGVPVFYNGPRISPSHGRNYAADGYYYGQRWQCTEFAKRFLHDARGFRMPDVWGHARDFFDPSVPQGGLNHRRGLLQFRNGGDEPPRPDDLLVFNDSSYGHVAVVTRVEDDRVEIVQQNVGLHTRGTFTMSSAGGRYTIDSPRAPAGWLRVAGVEAQ